MLKRLNALNTQLIHTYAETKNKNLLILFYWNLWWWIVKLVVFKEKNKNRTRDNAVPYS